VKPQQAETNRLAGILHINEFMQDQKELELITVCNVFVVPELAETTDIEQFVMSL
jgi:hypothetical protein